MAHLSEKDFTLIEQRTVVHTIDALEEVSFKAGDIPVFWLPAHRSQNDALKSEEAFRKLAGVCGRLSDDATICVLTTPPDAAQLIPYLEGILKFQLWIAVKTSEDIPQDAPGLLPARHAALLVLTRYPGTLRHTKTRIGYTYCPACRKTTKDYGGKKHTYHEYGTLMSDIWRDIECSPNHNIDAVVERLRDLFSVEPYKHLQVVDLRGCRELLPDTDSTMQREARLPIEWEEAGLPIGSLLLNGDCLEALRGLPDNSVDFCFTDPPYNIQKKYDSWNDGLEMVKYFEWCDQWLSELFRVLKPGRTLAVLNIPQWAVRHYQHLNSIMKYQAWIAWEELSLPARMIMPAHYAILCFSKGDPRPLPGLAENLKKSKELECLRPLQDFYCVRASCISERQRRGLSDRTEVNDLWSDIHRLKHNSRRVDHPCQLPPLLMQRLYALFTEPGELVLDCFDGAGTSTLVAHQMGRRFIGIELSEQYHQLAKSRHEQIARGEDPFGKIDAVPTAKNSRVQRVTKQKYAVTKKELQMDVKRIAKDLGRLPTRQEVEELSLHSIEFFDNYFMSWGEACAAARTTGMSELPKPGSEAPPQLALFSDL